MATNITIPTVPGPSEPQRVAALRVDEGLVGLDGNEVAAHVFGTSRDGACEGGLLQHALRQNHQDHLREERNDPFSMVGPQAQYGSVWLSMVQYGTV